MRAALFDLDGTLFDSMYVWRLVDEVFFSRRGMTMPEDYPVSISGMSYLRTAEYTKERFSLEESVREIADEWTRTAREEYALHVPLKEGSKEFLEMLRGRGVKLCVVTTLLRDLYEPCLIRNGIFSLFEFVLTTDQARSASKAEGTIYRIAARRLGARPEECAVFEDVEEGIRGAKAAGMYAYCVIDPRSTHHPERVRLLADDSSPRIGQMRIAPWLEL